MLLNACFLNYPKGDERLNRQFGYNNSDQFRDDPLFNFEDKQFYNTVLLNGNLGFIATRDSDFRIGETSDALYGADPVSALGVPLDILGNSRILLPDIGAYEFVPED